MNQHTPHQSPTRPDHIAIGEPTPDHGPQILALLEKAFETEDEALLVADLRAGADPLVEIIALEHGLVVGHVMLSPGWVEPPGHETTDAWCLAPLAVAPSHQRLGIGGRLTRAACEAALEIRRLPIFVLGHPDYYPRLGFQPAVPLGFSTTFLPPQGPAEAFMLFAADDRIPTPGPVRFHPAFDRFA